jgi:hypothetical protein
MNMKRPEFMALCGKYLIDVDIALENENIREALSNRNDEEVKRILQEEF